MLSFGLMGRGMGKKFKIWLPDDGLDFVFATFIAMQDPDGREVAAAQRVVEGIDFR